MTTLLDQLKQMTIVVADTGDIQAIQQFTPRDATTNPSLITAAAQMPQYQPIVDETLRLARHEAGLGATPDQVVAHAFDRLAVAFGMEILKIIPGRVSTEVDARLSYDTEATVEKARFLIAQYEAGGIDRERVLIKIASTWEGIKAAEIFGKRRHPLQSDPVIWSASSRSLCRSQSHPHFSLCRQNSGLVQEGNRHRTLSPRRRPWRNLCNENIQLLQEVWLQNGSDGG
jgi:hypothetical protein